MCALFLRAPYDSRCEDCQSRRALLLSRRRRGPRGALWPGPCGRGRADGGRAPSRSGSETGGKTSALSILGGYGGKAERPAARSRTVGPAFEEPALSSGSRSHPAKSDHAGEGAGNPSRAPRRHGGTSRPEGFARACGKGRAGQHAKSKALSWRRRPVQLVPSK